MILYISFRTTNDKLTTIVWSFEIARVVRWSYGILRMSHDFLAILKAVAELPCEVLNIFQPDSARQAFLLHSHPTAALFPFMTSAISSANRLLLTVVRKSYDKKKQTSF